MKNLKTITNNKYQVDGLSDLLITSKEDRDKMELALKRGHEQLLMIQEEFYSKPSSIRKNK